MTPPIHKHVRVTRAFEGEVVEIQWKCLTGETWYERRTCPPKATREAQTQAALPGTESHTIEEVLPPAVKKAMDPSASD